MARLSPLIQLALFAAKESLTHEPTPTGCIVVGKTCTAQLLVSVVITGSLISIQVLLNLNVVGKLVMMRKGSSAVKEW